MADGGIETTGRDELVAKMNRLAGTDTFTAQVGMQSTTGSVRHKDGPVDVSRSAVENIIVMRAQAKDGREFAQLTDSEVAHASDMWRAAISKFLETSSAADLETGARLVAEYIVEAERKHIEQGGVGASNFKPVLPSTQKQKDREVRPGLPPLVRTGQLMRALIAGVRRG